MSNRFARCLRTALIVALALMLAAAPALASGISVKLNASTKVYKSATTSSASVKAPKNLQVTLNGYKNGWAEIGYQGYTGYVKLKYLDRCDPVKAYVKSSAAVYRGAGSKKLGTAPKGTVVYVVGMDGSYAHVQNKSGSVKGYIKSSLLSATKVEGTAENPSSPASEIPKSLRSTTKSKNGSKIEYTIYLAQNLLGKPYAEKANPPKTFDCANLAYFCYSAAKKGSMLNSALTQGYDERYQKISYENLKRGDLLCFDTVDDADLSDHVGIYLGSGYFIHASSVAKKVMLSSLSSGYYKRTFSWGRRIFNS